VGVIREGRLLAVREIDAMRRATLRRMVIRFVDSPPMAELELPGVELVEHNRNEIVLRIRGELDPLLKVLARHRVEHLVFPEPSLEEAFVKLYRSSEGDSS
jgi:ABC-2 type transport system ATP-binding protein